MSSLGGRGDVHTSCATSESEGSAQPVVDPTIMEGRHVQLTGLETDEWQGF